MCHATLCHDMTICHENVVNCTKVTVQTKMKEHERLQSALVVRVFE